MISVVKFFSSEPSELDHQSPNAILQYQHVKVYQQPNLDPAKLKICYQLSVMNRRERRDRLDFYDHDTLPTDQFDNRSQV